jgi:dolichyl-phosphate mannosyltransferase polypeptide 3
MTRAQRLALITTILTTLYLLAFFAVVPVPFVDAALVQEILPLVRIVVF